MDRDLPFFSTLCWPNGIGSCDRTAHLPPHSSPHPRLQAIVGIEKQPWDIQPLRTSRQTFAALRAAIARVSVKPVIRAVEQVVAKAAVVGHIKGHGRLAKTKNLWDVDELRTGQTPLA